MLSAKSLAGSLVFSFFGVLLFASRAHGRAHSMSSVVARPRVAASMRRTPMATASRKFSPSVGFQTHRPLTTQGGYSTALSTLDSSDANSKVTGKLSRRGKLKSALKRATLGSLVVLGAGAVGVPSLFAATKAAAVAAQPNLEELMLKTVIPSIGTFLSNALYFSFLPGVKKAVSDGSLGSLNPIPVAFQLISTIAWASYGLAIQNPYIALSNVPAVVLSMWAVSSILPLIRDQKQLTGFKNLVTMGAAGVAGLWSALTFFINPAQHAFVLGASATALCIVLFASPLTAIGEVISKKDASKIYAPFAIVQAINCLMWFAYGLKINDVWVFGPNATGLGLGLIQLFLLLIFRKPQTTNLSTATQ